MTRRRWEEDLRPALLEHLESADYRPAGPRQILRRLGLPAGRQADLEHLLRQLEEEGRVTARRGRWILRAAATGRVVGRFVRHPVGYGFVHPDDRAEPDVFLNPRRAEGLLHGDRIEVEVVRVDHRGRREGRLVRVVEAAPRRLTGVLELRGGDGRVFPYEERLARSVLIESRRTAGAADGMAVGVELTRLPDEQGVARGRVVEVLGYPDEPGMDIEIIIRKYDLPHQWPEEVTAEVLALPDAPEADEIRRREDFTALPTVTIDGETAKDFDDAVSVERGEAGGWRLYVHIADVGHYVREGTALDREALRRGTSVYFPGRAVPMLPEKLSNDLCSLNPQVPRLVHSVILVLDRRGNVTGARFSDGVIRSAERMTYTRVGRILEERDPTLRERYAALVPDLESMEELCRRLHARRRERGSLDFDLPEPEIVLDARGEMTGVFPSPRNIAHRMIEEFMLAANEAVAHHLVDREVPALFRVHEEPEEGRLEALDDALKGLGYRLPQPLSAIQPRHLQEILDLASGKPEERFVSHLVLRSLMLARYGPRNLGHFGLAAPRYTHFTSPIRRYPDLVVHRVLRAHRRGDLAPGSAAAERLEASLPEVAEQSSKTERVAEDAERELEAWKKLGFMADRLGEEYHGYVSGVMPFGLFVELEEYFVEGLIHVSSLPGGRYDFDERGYLLRGKETGRVFRLGDRLQVRVVKVDHFQRRMDLELVGEESAPGGRRRSRRR